MRPLVTFIGVAPLSPTRLRRAHTKHRSHRVVHGHVINVRASLSRDERTAAHPLSEKYPTPRAEPPTLRAHHYINLTNGLESLGAVTRLARRDAADAPANIRFTRLQSSHCEAGAYDKLLWSVDNELLLALACGRPCFVHDRGSRDRSRGVPRSLFLGLQFVRWALAYLWFGASAPHLVPTRSFVRGKNTVPFWRDEVLPFKIGKDTKKRIRYFAPYAAEMGTTDVRLYGVYGRTSDVDGCMGVYVKMMREWLERESCALDEPVPGREGDACIDAELELQVWMDEHKMSLVDAGAREEEVVAVQEWMRDDADRRGHGQVVREVKTQ